MPTTLHAPAFTRRSGAAWLAGLILVSAGCATFKPPPPAPETWRDGAQTQDKSRVRVSAALLTGAESKQVFGADLVAGGVQPIWIEVENRGDDDYFTMLLSVDPAYYAPSELAWKTRSTGERNLEDRMAFFLERHIPMWIAPKTTATGFVYANFDPGAKAFTVDLIGERERRQFDFLLEVPGFQADYQKTQPDTHYERGEIRDLDLAGLRAYLEGLPCCVLGGDQKTPGDPLNLVIVGEGDDVLSALVRRGWDLTETVTAGTAFRTAMSSVFGSRYRTSPVSPLYVFDRPQDAAFQKSRRTVDERNHLRLWLAPVSFEGRSVWVGQISRDIGVKLSSRTFVTHKIDPVVDEARVYLLMDLAKSGSLARAGHVKGVGVSRPSEPRVNFTYDPYYTDGLRVVLIIAPDPVGLDNLDILDWERVPDTIE